MQLTFMEINADGLNPNKSYLSKWLGINGGSSATTFVNDGRPIVGIAGMWSKKSFGPAFCMCLVTTKAGALAADHLATVTNGDDVVQVECTLDEHGKVLASRVLPR